MASYREQKEGPADLERLIPGRVEAIKSDNAETTKARNSEVWNQVGMLEEEIGRIGNSIDALRELLEAAGVLEPPTKLGREESVEEEPPSCTRLGGVLQNMRRVLDLHNECVCVVMARLGV
jgi:predicted RNA-binding protein YlqC (UPF0109 family)